MRGLYRYGLMIFLVFAFLFSTYLIPTNINARVNIKQEVSFGKPGELPYPIMGSVPNTSNSPGTTVTASSAQNNPREMEGVSAWILYSKIIFSQFLSFVF